MKKILITFFSGITAVLITGMLFHRFDIFNIHSPNFQFVSAGILASILYPVSLYRENRDIFYVAVLLFVVHFILFKPGTVQFIIRDVIYISAVISAAIVYALYILPLIKKYKILKIFAFPFTLGIFYIAAFLLLSLESYLFFGTRISDFLGMLGWFIKYGAIIGFGLGIGFNFAEFIIKNYFESEQSV